jgi:hypothetical protein
VSATYASRPPPLLPGANNSVPVLAQGSVKVVVYEGQAQPRSGVAASRNGRPQQVVSAAELAAAHFVLTTFDVLRRDQHNQPDPSGRPRALRSTKKYEVLRDPPPRTPPFSLVTDASAVTERGMGPRPSAALRVCQRTASVCPLWSW